MLKKYNFISALAINNMLSISPEEEMAAESGWLSGP